MLTLLLVSSVFLRVLCGLLLIFLLGFSPCLRASVVAFGFWLWLSCAVVGYLLVVFISG